MKFSHSVSGFSVKGYKSIKDELQIDLAPLTLLVGTNSSGKSSVMQPLLILKQTLEAPFDPGALLMNGSNVRITSPEQVLSKIGKEDKKISIGFSLGNNRRISVSFEAKKNKGFLLASTNYEFNCKDELLSFELTPSTSFSEIRETIGKLYPAFRDERAEFSVEKRRIFLTLSSDMFATPVSFDIAQTGILRLLRNMIHLSGLRGNPERSYQTIAMEKKVVSYPGPFENYTASIVAHWQENESAHDKLLTLHKNAKRLGLFDVVQADYKSDSEIALNISRVMSPRRSGKSGKPQKRDMVNIADVGLGVPQVLPVLVALIAAEKGQLVYIEQPEIHLHPRAQHLLAKPIVDAANRGARVVIETHSSILLTGIQELGAKGKISPDKVAMYWFSRNDDGATKAVRADLDENFAFGDWPEDFSETSFEADMAYVNAVSEKEENA